MITPGRVSMFLWHTHTCKRTEIGFLYTVEDTFMCTVGRRNMGPLLHLLTCDIYVSIAKKPYCAIHPSIAFALHVVLGVGLQPIPADHGRVTHWSQVCHTKTNNPSRSKSHLWSIHSQVTHTAIPDTWTLQTSHGKASGCPQGIQNQTPPS